MIPDKALFLAIDRQDTQAVKTAIAMGANLHARRKFNTPLLEAVFTGNDTIVRLLVKAGATIEHLQNTRDPLTEALSKGSIPVLAALFEVDATPQAVAEHMRIRFEHGEGRGNLGHLRSLLAPAWETTLAQMGALGLIACQAKGWWAAACDSYAIREGSVKILEQHAPLSHEKEDLRGQLAKNGGSPWVFEAFKRAGLLDEAAMFHMPFQGERGMFALTLRQRHKPMPVLTWMAKHAINLPTGRQVLARHIHEYLALAMGLHASLPLSRLLAKAAGVDAFQEAARGSTHGATTLHLLMDGVSEYKKRLDIAQTLLENGADPMALDMEGQPACYRGAFKQTHTPRALQLFDQHGVDWGPTGDLAQRVARDTTIHLKRINDAMDYLYQFDRQKQHRLLEECTPRATAHAIARRF